MGGAGRVQEEEGMKLYHKLDFYSEFLNFEFCNFKTALIPVMNEERISLLEIQHSSLLR